MLEMREKSEKDMRVRLVSEFKGSIRTPAWPKHRLPELSTLLTGKLPDPRSRPPSVSCVLRDGQRRKWVGRVRAFSHQRGLQVMEKRRFPRRGPGNPSTRGGCWEPHIGPSPAPVSLYFGS